MVSMASAAQRVKSDPGAVLSREQVQAACDRVKHRFRCRTLDPFLTIISMVVQVMHGNTAIAHLVRLMHGAFNGSAYCQARARLPLGVMLELLAEMARRVRGVLEDVDTPGDWYGHRTLLVDGSGFSMPDTPALVKFFGLHPHQRPGVGFPVGYFVALFDAATGLLIDLVVAAGRAGELTLAAGLRQWLRRGDILIGDRAFCSFAHLAVLGGLGVDALFRLHQQRKDHRPVRRKRRRRRPDGNVILEPTLVRRISRHDRIVEWIRPMKVPPWLTRAQLRRLPRTLQIRIIRFSVSRRGWRTKSIVVATTLLDPHRYPDHQIAQLYMSRWSIEVNLRHLKQTMGMDVLRCQSVPGVKKEILAFALVYNLVRLVMLEAASRQQVDPNRISFVDTLRWLQSAEPTDPFPRLKVNPLRPGRFEPRVRKRRPSRNYPLMQRPRPTLKADLLKRRRCLI